MITRNTARDLDGGAVGSLGKRPMLYLVGESEMCRRLRDADVSRLLGQAPVISDAASLASAGPEEPELRVAITDSYAQMASLLADGHAASRTWLPCVFADGALGVGPLTGPRFNAWFEDLAARLMTTGSAEPAPATDWNAAELAWVTSVLVQEVRRYCEGELCLSAEHQLVLRPHELSVTSHRVLPLPFDGKEPRLPHARRPGEATIASLIDARTGIITGLRRAVHHESIPRELITIVATVANMRRISPWMTDPAGGGCSFSNEAQATNAAIGEAIERYSGEIVQERLLRRATWRELARQGENAVDPDSLELFSAAQYASPGFPFVPLTRDLRISWVRGWSLSEREPAWLPASLAYPNWYTGGNEKDPHTNNPFYPGLAAGPDLEFAIAAGIQEIVERDATMVWWANAHRLPAIHQPAALQALWAGRPAELGQRAWLIHLDNEFGIPVMAGLVENEAEKLFTMGFAARPDAASAGLKAWAEALTLQDTSRDLLGSTSRYRRAIAKGRVNGEFVKPYRADRRYLDDYRGDLRDMVDLACQVQVYLDPRSVERVREWADVPATRQLADLPRLADGSMRSYQEAVEARGYRIYYADLTTSDIEPTGMRVVRVLIPGLVPNFAAAFPFQGRGRIRTAAVDLGWRTEPLAEGEINLFPIAHA